MCRGPGVPRLGCWCAPPVRMPRGRVVRRAQGSPRGGRHGHDGDWRRTATGQGTPSIPERHCDPPSPEHRGGGDRGLAGGGPGRCYPPLRPAPPPPGGDRCSEERRAPWQNPEEGAGEVEMLGGRQGRWGAGERRGLSRGGRTAGSAQRGFLHVLGRADGGEGGGVAAQVAGTRAGSGGERACMGLAG